jgi:hypothetical protein
MRRTETPGSTVGRRLIARIAAVVTMTFAVSFPGSGAAAADLDTEVVFHIAAQRLDNALLEFSKQANTPVAFAARSIGTLRTPGLNGKFPSRLALTVLLCNSGLAYVQVGDTITVVPNSGREDTKPCAVAAEAAPKS